MLGVNNISFDVEKQYGIILKIRIDCPFPRRNGQTFINHYHIVKCSWNSGPREGCLNQTAMLASLCAQAHSFGVKS